MTVRLLLLLRCFALQRYLTTSPNTSGSLSKRVSASALVEIHLCVYKYGRSVWKEKLGTRTLKREYFESIPFSLECHL